MKGLQMKYFVLNPKSKSIDDPYAEASRLAMLAYSDRIRRDNLMLADDLRKWIEQEANTVAMEKLRSIKPPKCKGR